MGPRSAADFCRQALVGRCGLSSTLGLAANGPLVIVTGSHPRPPSGGAHSAVSVDDPVAPRDWLDTGPTVTKPAPGGATWTSADVAAYLQVSESYLRTVRRVDYTLPAPRLVGRSPRWMPRAIEGWLAGRIDQQPGTVDCGEAAWTLTDVAAHIERSTRQLRRLREVDLRIPEPRMIGSVKRWHPDVIRGWTTPAPVQLDEELIAFRARPGRRSNPLV